MPRDDAYKAVQENSMAAWETESSFRDRVAADPRVTKYLDAAALAHTFDLHRQLRTWTPSHPRLRTASQSHKTKRRIAPFKSAKSYAEGAYPKVFAGWGL